MPLLLAQTSTFHEVKYGLPVNFQPDFLCSQSPWEVYMLDPVRPSPVRANKLGRSLSQFALRDTANRSCWPVGPSATMQHSVAAMGCPCVCVCVCVWAAHDPRPAKPHKHANAVQRPSLFGLFSLLAGNPWCSLTFRCITPISISVFTWHFHFVSLCPNFSLLIRTPVIGLAPSPPPPRPP